MSSRKSTWLEGALRHLLQHGVANASLRPLAAALGTSPRILMFHFKSKEMLLQEVMREVNVQLQKKLESFSKAQSPASNIAPLKQFWEWATSPDHLPYFRLLYEVQIIAVQNPAAYGTCMAKSSSDWRELALESMSQSLKKPLLADLCIAVFDGLMLEFIVTGDRERLTVTLDHFITILRNSAPHASSPTDPNYDSGGQAK
jgi:AcrR family transcriptional regulator